MILGAEPVLLRQYVAPAVDPDTGAAVVGEPLTCQIMASVQPLNGNDLELLPEGDRAEDSRRLYTASEVRTADQHCGRPADQIIIDGKTYKVIEVKRQRSVIPHYRVLCVRLREAV